jgi:hypothetical protein
MPHDYALERVYLSPVIRTCHADIVLRESVHPSRFSGLPPFDYFAFPQDDAFMSLMILVEGFGLPFADGMQFVAAAFTFFLRDNLQIHL